MSDDEVEIVIKLDCQDSEHAKQVRELLSNDRFQNKLAHEVENLLSNHDNKDRALEKITMVYSFVVE